MDNETPVLAAGIKAKLISWWNGYDSPALDVLDRYKQVFLHWWNGDPESPSGVNLGARRVRKRAIEAPHAKKQDISARAMISQALWGEGNLTPGPAEYVTELTARLGLTPEMSMLDLGAGLGGPSRAISSAYGVWVTALEAVSLHVKAGMEQSIMHGMGKKVPISQFDPETFDIPARKYDCIFSKEMMHHVKEKKRLIAEIERGLKAQGQFIITSYVVTDKGVGGPHVAAWNAADGQVNHFWSKGEYSAAFAEAKLDLRVTEDLTQRYCEIIADGFRGLMKNMESLLASETEETRQSELRRALAFESNRWAVRAEALQSGDIAVLRFSGLNPLRPEIR
ncbi:MAG: SAM-dependent methyltransferase [Pseudomonadota bacterium]